MPDDLFAKWLEEISPTPKGGRLYRERSKARRIGLGQLKKLLADHFVGEATITKAGGYKKAAEIIQNSLPTNKRTRSGDLGELIATEYVDSQTPFRAPIRKLRWKSDREMPMHGNDVVAVDASSSPVRVAKVECKSRATFSDAVVAEAIETLDAHGGRPNPSTLAFIAKRLYEEDRDAEAKVFQDLQTASSIAPNQITHMIFALCGNDPCASLEKAGRPRQAGIKRANAAVVIADHVAFVADVFTK